MPDPEPTPNAALACALRYAAVGMRVLPIPAGRKHPPMAAWQDAATTDPAIITAWWEGLYAGHGVGIALDQLPDGRWLFAVDIDGASHGVDGGSVWAELCDAYGAPEATVEATTGGGGAHLLYASPHEIRNGRLADGIDIRGHGGQIVVEPSVHASGVAYGWVEGQAPDEHAVADALPWLLGIIEHTDSPEAPTTPPRPRTAQRDGERPGDLWAAATSWSSILERDGWTLHHVDRTGEQHWTRPGKATRDGTSATVDYMGADTLKMFSTAVPGLDAEATYTKLGYLAATRYGGDHSAASRALRADGYHAAEADLDELLGGEQRRPRSREQVTPGTPWPDPQPIPQGAPTPPFPHGVYPAWAEAHIDNIATQLDCARDLPAMFFLGALATLGMRHLQVRPRVGQTMPTNLYLVVAALPGEGKSPALSMIFAPVRAFEDERMTQAVEDVARAEAAQRIAEGVAKAAEDHARKSRDPRDADEATRLRVEAAMIVVPPTGRLITGDVTPEAMAQLMADNAERIAVVSDESGALNLDRYGDRRAGGRNLDIVLQAYTGEPVIVDRKTGPPVRLKSPLLTMCVGAQPKALHAALADDEFRVRGLGARFMSATPTARGAAMAVDLRRVTWNAAVAADYDQQLGALARLWGGWQTPATLALSTDAQDAYSAWAQPLQERRALGGDLEADTAWVVKMRDSIIRVAGLLHAADGRSHDDEVDAATMRRAIAVGNYWIGHRLYEVGTDGDNARRLLFALGRLAPAADDGVVTPRAMMRGGPRGLRTIAALAAPLDQLVDLGWARIVTDLPASVSSDMAGHLRSMRGVRVHPEAWRDADIGGITGRGDSGRQDATPATPDHDERSATTDGRQPSPHSHLSLYKGFLPLSLSQSSIGERAPQTGATGATAPPDDPPEGFALFDSRPTDEGARP